MFKALLSFLKRFVKREYANSSELAEAILRELNRSGYAGFWFASLEVAEEVFSILPQGEVIIHKIEFGSDRVEVDFLLPGFALAA